MIRVLVVLPSFRKSLSVARKRPTSCQGKIMSLVISKDNKVAVMSCCGSLKKVFKNQGSRK